MYEKIVHLKLMASDGKNAMLLAEATTTAISKEKQPKGFVESRVIAKESGQIAGTARKGIEQKTGESVISNKNAKN